jgi:hypothetical protein
MKIFFLPQWFNDKFFLNISIILTFLLISYYIISNGPNIGSPDTNIFAGWANSLIKVNFNFAEFYSQNYFDGQIYFYTVNIIIFSLSKVIFGSEWFYALFALNLLLVFF